jgi:hypothetical protein
MKVDIQISALGPLAIAIALLSLAYFRLSLALAKTDQALAVWEYIAETPILGNHVARIFTMLIKIRNPYSRSIGTMPHTSQ